MKIKADLIRHPERLRPAWCQVEKVVELTGPDFDAFLIAPQEEQPFLADNAELMHQWNGVSYCLLVLAEGRTDGVLVDSEGGPCARYAAYLPQARTLVTAELERAVDFIVRQGTEHTASGSWCVCCEDLEERFGLTIPEGSGLDAMLKDALERRPEVAAVEMSNGAVETTFHPEFCAELRGKIRVLKVEPGKPPEEITMPNTLEAFQAAVGGYIEVLGLDGDALLICNEEGKLIGLPPNRRVGGDTIAGTFLITGSADGEFCSLSDEDAAHYAKEFEQPMPVYGNPDEPTQWEFHVF